MKFFELMEKGKEITEDEFVQAYLSGAMEENDGYLTREERSIAVMLALDFWGDLHELTI